jgi:hypothetical protein
MSPPRELRNTAILFMFTLSFVMENTYLYGDKITQFLATEE